jgi:hypothetical protein
VNGRLRAGTEEGCWQGLLLQEKWSATDLKRDIRGPDGVRGRQTCESGREWRE